MTVVTVWGSMTRITGKCFLPARVHKLHACVHKTTLGYGALIKTQNVHRPRQGWVLPTIGEWGNGVFFVVVAEDQMIFT